MSDHFFDAARAAGEYPPKGWGWKTRARQRQLLSEHVAKGCELEPWMVIEAYRLGISVIQNDSEAG
jgi:hypothetical protein